MNFLKKLFKFFLLLSFLTILGCVKYTNLSDDQRIVVYKLFTEEKSYIETNLMNNKKSMSYNKISGTQFRKLLLNSQLPESWLARKKISQMLLDSLSNGEKVFVE